MSQKSFVSRSSLLSACVAALGGILFGYNTSVISGVLLFIAKSFDLTTFEQELIVSTLLIGAIIGALTGGVLADLFGRKKTLFLTIFLFFIGILILVEAQGFFAFLIGRFISGIATGIVSMAAPLYIAEVSPPDRRGSLVSLNQFCITLGILLAYIITYVFSKEGEWRDMFAFALLPLLVQFVGLFFIPETPAWLISKKKEKKAEQALEKLSLQRSFFEDQEDKEKTASLFSYKFPFLIGIGIAVFQSITGINIVIYYAPRIFQLAGFESDESALFVTMLIGIVNVIITIFALWLIDRVGRRPLLMTGLIGMGLSLGILGLSFLWKNEISGIVAAVTTIAYVGCFAFSLGPIAWLLISEVYPLEIRGKAVGIATFSNWFCNYFISLTFLSLLNEVGTSLTFWIYTGICLLALLFVIKFVPETKGKTFKQIQEFWKKS